MDTRNRPASVAILALPEVGVSTVYGMFDMFMSAGRDWGVIVDGTPGNSLIAPRVIANTREAFAAGNGVIIRADATLDEAGVPDVVCVPELLVAPGEPIDGRFRAEVEFLRRCHDAGATVATACSGALLLAEAGLLDGHDATTHWAYCDILQRRYPRVRVHAQRALVVAGAEQRLVMAGGGTSWLDLALYLIARLAGVEAAMQVARLNLIDWHAVGQQPFARLARSRQTDDSVIARCQEWIAGNYAAAGPVAQMTRLSGLAERSFTRRFREATGMAPLEYVHTLRLEEAKQMLETCEQPVEGIANEVGYEDAAFFSRLFRRKVGLTPVQYRRRFGSLRRSLTSGNA
ncbi:MAG TPA: helix-turn-helix domain-containing protein [Steroidobacteraceae bacterium]|nr:helix-turn-helix domain-containing protein [Steroidobacteraceae bacterium]